MIRRFIPFDEDGCTYIIIDGEAKWVVQGELNDINTAIDSLNKTIIRFLICRRRGNNRLRALPKEIINIILHYISLPPYMIVRKSGQHPVKLGYGLIVNRAYIERLFAKKTTYERDEDRKKKLVNKNNRMIARSENRRQKWKFK